MRSSASRRVESPSHRVERRRPNRLGIASKFKEKPPTAIFLRNDLTQPSRTTPRPQNSAQARIIEKEKVLTNMQEHLAHIQELEAERAAKHQEKRDKAKQKVVISVQVLLQFGVSRRVGAVILAPHGRV